MAPPRPCFRRLTNAVAADPDRSNPTRSRWERPLETIRSFEAAIDGAYNRKSMVRAGKPLVDHPLSKTHYLTRDKRRIRQST